MMFAFLQRIALKSLRGIGKGNGASESMINTGYASFGRMGRPGTWRLSIITRGGKMPKSLLNPTSPGEMLVEEFLKPMGISAHKLALDLHVPASRIDEIIKGKRGVTADTALR